MPALLQVTIGTRQPRPSGFLGVPVHGLLFSALETVSPALSAQLHAAEVKGFRIGQVRWEEGPEGAQVVFQVGVLDDALLDPLLEALTVGRTHGDEQTSLWGELLDMQVTARTSYGDSNRSAAGRRSAPGSQEALPSTSLK